MTKKPIAIGSYSIGGTNECFIIAEMGSNHDGKISRAKNLIDIAGEAGCSAVKIQVVFSAECYPPNTKYPAHYGDEDLAEVIRRKEIPTEWVAELRKYTNDNGMLFGAREVSDLADFRENSGRYLIYFIFSLVLS